MQQVFELILKRLRTKIHPLHNANWNAAIEEAIDTVQYVQEICNDKWIPCNIEMPKHGKKCWITYKWADGTIHVDDDWYIDGNWHCTLNEAVVAWMYKEPPKPYKPKGE